MVETQDAKVFTDSDFLKVPTTDLARVLRRVEAGFPLATLDHLQATVELPIARLASLLRIPPRTLARRREQGRLSAEESDRLLRVARLFAAATNLFAGDVGAAVDWLSKPLAAIGGKVPLDIADTEIGSRAVENVIQQLEHGVFP